MNDEIAETNSIPFETPSTNARNAVVMSDIRNARMTAIKRGLNDMVLQGMLYARVGFRHTANLLKI